MSDLGSDAFIREACTTSVWLDQLGPIEHRAPLDGDTSVDVAIVGGGFSGLWTAWYLTRVDPTLRIAVIEREHCGFGASGRNGGWAVGELSATPAKYARTSSPDAAMRQLRGVFDAVDEIGRVTRAEGINCGYAKGGWIRIANNEPQAKRQREEIPHEYAQGFTEDDMRLLSADEARTYLNGSNVLGGIYFSACAALDPGRLVRGLADAVEAAGVTVFEGTAVQRIDTAGMSAAGTSGRVITNRGTITADVVVQATEGYTRDLHGQRRALLPIYSLMVATEPLPDSMFEEIGLANRPTFSDDRFMVTYGQRTEDNRLAFGGRGVPYLFGSTVSPQAETHEESHALIRSTLIEMLPVLADVTFTHRWGGVMGAPRDWMPRVTFDRTTGRGMLGGYVGEGVAAANLAGRTMADLITGQNTERAGFPWVDHRSRNWEPEPLRWLGVRGSRSVLGLADEREYRTDKEARTAYRISQLLKGS